MLIEMKSSFAKAMKKINQPEMANEVLNIIEEIQIAQNLFEIKNVKKLKGAKNSYRVKLFEHSDYRIGFTLNNSVICLVVLVSTYCYTFVKTGFDVILQLFFISLPIISKYKIKLM